MRAAVAALALAGATCGCARPAAQAAACPGPHAGWATPADGIPHLAIVNRLTLSRAGALRWNGVPTDRATLRRYMRIMATLEPRPFTILAPDLGVDCAVLEATRADMEAGGACTKGICGEGRGRWELISGLFVPPAPGDHSEAANAARDLEATADKVMDEANAPATALTH